MVMNRFLFYPVLLVTVAGFISSIGASTSLMIKPDLVVAVDGTGDFRSIQEAVQSIPATNRERRIILVKDGTYTEKVRVEAPFVTIHGQSREGTRVEFSISAQDLAGRPNGMRAGVLNLGATAHDFVLENMTVKNAHGVLGIHAFAICGWADRVVLLDSDVLSQGNDTISLWRGGGTNAAAVAASVTNDDTGTWREGGRYYHARLNVAGSVDFICPRGWCYMRDSTITELNPRAEASIWHDGSGNPDKKFVLRNCRFDGPPNWYLARHHHDAQFFLVDCTFSEAMRDKPPYRVIYPLNGTPTEADIRRNKDLDRSNVYGERAYFSNCHRVGGDYAWHHDNLDKAPGSPKPCQITPSWTFAGSWDPERTNSPAIQTATVAGQELELRFDEAVTVKGHPRVVYRPEVYGDYLQGSGTRTLRFGLPTSEHPHRLSIELNGGEIIANEAGATIRKAELRAPEIR
jgi:pectinesterase